MSVVYTAKDVLAALARRHSGDVFVPECNLGSATQGCRRIDAWAMPKSWAPLRTIGYEIKVSRSDWTVDNKWHEYAEFVHELWIACPAGMIEKYELPDGIGLVWLGKTGKLTAKRKAVRQLKVSRAIEAMAYVLMSRTIVERPSYAAPVNPATIEDWEEWAKGHEEHRDVMRLVAAKIEAIVGDIRTENAELKSRQSGVDKLRGALSRIGLDPDRTTTWNIESRVAQVRGLVNPRTLGDMKSLGRELASMAERLSKLHEVS